MFKTTTAKFAAKTSGMAMISPLKVQRSNHHFDPFRSVYW
jgi:hypothetical protein